MTKEFVCIVCPNSCHLTVSDDSGEIKVVGNSCPRGEKHGISEFTCPMRMITTTVSVKDGILPRLSVVSTGEVPREKLKQCLEEIYKIQIKAPIKVGDPIIKNIQGTGVDIVASRSMDVKE